MFLHNDGVGVNNELEEDLQSLPSKANTRFVIVGRWWFANLFKGSVFSLNLCQAEE